MNQLPHDLKAEVSVLTELLLDPEASTSLKPDDFYAERHRVVFQALSDLKATGDGITLITVIDRLRAEKKIEAAGGIDYVSGLLDGMPTGIEHHAKIVREKAQLRRLVHACQESIADAMEGQKASDVFIATERRLLGVTETRQTTDGFRPVSEAVMAGLEMIERAGASESGMLGIPTGIPLLDWMTAGFEPGCLTILAARPAMGKSALAWQFAEKFGMDGHGSLIASYEMGSGQLGRRGLSRLAHIDASRVKRGKLEKHEWEALAKAANRISELPIWINEYPPHEIEQLRSQVQRHMTKHDVKVVLVDYLQQMSGPKQGNRNNEIEHISRGLKRMAREMNIHVVALAQLSRGPEYRKPPRPILSDLRDSGAVEQDADNVLMLWRPEYYFDESTPDEAYAKWQGMAELIVTKQRDGETGGILLEWHGPTLSFKPAPKPESQRRSA